jgi:hypothetical protein
MAIFICLFEGFKNAKTFVFLVCYVSCVLSSSQLLLSLKKKERANPRRKTKPFVRVCACHGDYINCNIIFTFNFISFSHFHAHLVFCFCFSFASKMTRRKIFSHSAHFLLLFSCCFYFLKA